MKISSKHLNSLKQKSEAVLKTIKSRLMVLWLEAKNNIYYSVFVQSFGWKELVVDKKINSLEAMFDKAEQLLHHKV